MSVLSQVYYGVWYMVYVIRYPRHYVPSIVLFHDTEIFHSVINRNPPSCINTRIDKPQLSPRKAVKRSSSESRLLGIKIKKKKKEKKESILAAELL